MRRIWESVIASVTGGLILWSVTSSVSRPAPTTERMTVAAAPTIQPTVVPSGSAIAAPTMSEAPAPRMDANRPLPASIPGPTIAMPASRANWLPYSIPVGSILLYENFAQYREGETTDWGPNTFIKTGLDHRNWLVSNVDGAHQVGRTIRLPNEFSFQCRYSANMPDVTRGILGWWKDPVSTKVSFLNEQGVKYVIEWAIGCGNDTTRLNPLGSSSLYAKKYYHTIKLPDGATSEIGIVQPTGMLRIDREGNVVKVFIDGQAAVVGTMSPMGQLVGFEIDVVKAKNGALSFTDFKIAR